MILNLVLIIALLYSFYTIFRLLKKIEGLEILMFQLKITKDLESMYNNVEEVVEPKISTGRILQ